jgi:hypothetical protein
VELDEDFLRTLQEMFKFASAKPSSEEWGLKHEAIVDGHD